MKPLIQLPGFDEYTQSTDLVPVTPGPNRKERNVVDFAHPIDAAIIKLLDAPYIKKIFEKYVDICVDIGEGTELATGIKITENNNPEIYQVIRECSDTLGIPVPYVVVSRSVSGVNAQTSGTDQFAYIAISSLLNMLMTTEEQHFVIGHECGHLALGHVVYHTAVRLLGGLGGLLPLVGDVIANTIQYPLNAWIRRSEISADRAGLICCRNLATAQKALLKLEAGFMNVDDTDINEYLENSRRFLSGNFLGKYRELFQSHPLIPKRIEALELFSRSEKYYRAIGEQPPVGMTLIGDEELEQRTHEIIKIVF